MDLSDKLKALAEKCRSMGPALKTEEATKMALVVPFLAHLGYDTHDPREVCPEFICDVGEKKKERVDFAIMHQDKPIILIECKQYGGCLEVSQGTQLERYFNATFARVAILTDGNRYRFFTDLEVTNRMDKRPYMEFTLESMDETLIPEISKLSKGKFDPDTATSAATDLKYTREFRRILDEQLTSPDDEFVKFFARKVYSGLLRESVVANFSSLLKKAMQRWLNAKINERLQNAINQEDATSAVAEAIEAISGTEEDENQIVTTEDEWHGYYLVKSILIGTVAPERVFIRDTLSYCGVLLDDNNRKPLCRLWFNRPQKYLGVFDKDKKEERIPINNLDDILNYADRIRDTAKAYDV